MSIVNINEQKPVIYGSPDLEHVNVQSVEALNRENKVLLWGCTALAIIALVAIGVRLAPERPKREEQ